MHDTAGIALIVGSSVVALITALVLRTRAPAVLSLTILALSGIALAVGALWVQEDVSSTEWVLTVLALTVLVPAHVRVVVGPFGPRPRSS